MKDPVGHVKFNNNCLLIIRARVCYLIGFRLFNPELTQTVLSARLSGRVKVLENNCILDYSRVQFISYFFTFLGNHEELSKKHHNFKYLKIKKKKSYSLVENRHKFMIIRLAL